MRAVNLIPPEDRRGERAPLRSGPLAYVIVGVLLLAFVGVYVLVATGNSIKESEAEVAGLEQQLEASQARADALQTFSSFAGLELSRTQTIADLARSRFDWERVLRELALVIPSDVSLTSLSGSVGSDANSSSAGGEINAPTLSMSGCTASHEGVARLLAALRDIDGVTRVGLSGSTESSGSSGSGGGAAAASSPDPAGSGGGCGKSRPASFDLVIAFDEVALDPASGGVVAPAPPAPVAGDESGVAETEQQRKAGQDDVEAAQKKSKNAVDTFVPGA